MKQFLFSTAFLFFCASIYAQQNNKALYATTPVWILMMDDEHVNYFTIQEAYNTYWQHHTAPAVEGDMDKTKPEQIKKRFSKKEIIEAKKDAAMRMQIKKYKWWLQKMEPFVQDDGSILRTNNN